MFSNLFSNDEISLLRSCCDCGCGCECNPVEAEAQGRKGGASGVSTKAASQFSTASS